METDPTRMCALLVGLPDVVVEAVAEWPAWLRVVIRAQLERPVCRCGAMPHRHGTREVTLFDLPVFGRPVRLTWLKQRWRCPGCATVWTEQDPRIASTRCALTTRAARWATFQVGYHGRTVAEVAADLGCDWHTVMDAVVVYGLPLINDPARIGAVSALGLDDALFGHHGPLRRQLWSTQIVDVRAGQLLDVVPGRDQVEPCRWLAARPDQWRAAIRWATLDLSRTYRAVLDTMLPDAVQVADPFHVVKLANEAMEQCRRRVQHETLGHRGHKNDPLYRLRRRLTMARERLTDNARERLVGLIRAGDPTGQLFYAWNAKEVVRQIYDHTDAAFAAIWIDAIEHDFAQPDMPPEVHRLGRTISHWRHQIIAWHRSHATNGPTEAINNLVKRVKRIAFGFRRFHHYRIRALLYAGQPNWTLLKQLTPP